MDPSTEWSGVAYGLFYWWLVLMTPCKALMNLGKPEWLTLDARKSDGAEI
jgi:hypothetical protein